MLKTPNPATPLSPGSCTCSSKVEVRVVFKFDFTNTNTTRTQFVLYQHDTSSKHETRTENGNKVHI